MPTPTPGYEETIAILRAEIDKLRTDMQEKIAALETQIGIMHEPTPAEIANAKVACEKARDAFPPLEDAA